MSKLIIEDFAVTINPQQSLSDLIVLAKKEGVIFKNINAQTFQDRYSENIHLRMGLFPCRESTSTSQGLQHIEAKGSRPATFRELIVAFRAYGDRFGTYRTVALGSLAFDPYHVPVLYRNKNTKVIHVDIRPLNTRWIRNGDQFLYVQRGVVY